MTVTIVCPTPLEEVEFETICHCNAMVEWPRAHKADARPQQPQLYVSVVEIGSVGLGTQ